MKNERGYGGIDRFRIAASLLVVAGHTYPLASVNESANFYLVRVVARIAVPFFLMATGFFVLPTCFSGDERQTQTVRAFFKKTGVLYALSSLLYLPLSVYAGYYADGNLALSAMRNILFDGTFYHLWYLPASLLGMAIMVLLSRKISLRAATLAAAGLYLAGLLGDSYFGLTERIPILGGAYGFCFQLFTYTRNGILYAPLFLALGANAANAANTANTPRILSVRAAAAGFALSEAALLLEGYILRSSGLPRHDSMYIALIPCVYFLFRLLLMADCPQRPDIRAFTLRVFILHPLFIIILRGIAKLAGLTALLVDNSVVHFAAVTLMTAGFTALTMGIGRKKAAVLTARAWVEIDTDNLRHNVRVLRSKLPVNSEIMAAVKANAYGHGAVEVARELNRDGVYSFCVATLAEGIELRKHRVKGEILVLGYTHPEQFRLLRKYRLAQTALDYGYARELDAFGKKLAVHIKIDTGMHRLGERADDTESILRTCECKNLRIKGIYTHLCADGCGSGADMRYTQTQLEAFQRVIAEIAAGGYPVPRTHVQSSQWIFARPDLEFDCARAGIALFGMLSSTAESQRYASNLRPVLSFKARVSAVKTLNAGESAGYGLAFTAERDMKIAVLSVGYADGVPRSLSCGTGSVLLGGREVPVVGRICMDQMTVDITEAADVRRGDVAVIIGSVSGKSITACELAERSGTIANEVLSRLGSRLTRVVK